MSISKGRIDKNEKTHSRLVHERLLRLDAPWGKEVREVIQGGEETIDMSFGRTER